MRAKDIMHHRVRTVRPETRLRELLRIFDEHGITGAPVVAPGGTSSAWCRAATCCASSAARA